MTRTKHGNITHLSGNMSRQTKSIQSENCRLAAQRLVDRGLPYFDQSAQLAGVQYEYNHKQTVYGTSTICNI